MADLEKLLKDLLYAGVGAVSTAIDKGGEVAKALVQKGQETLEGKQDTLEDLKQKAKETLDSLTRLNVHDLSDEEREDLRRQLKEMDEEVAAAEEAAREAERAAAEAEARANEENEAKKAAEATREAPAASFPNMDTIAQEAIDTLKKAAAELRKAMGLTDDDDANG